MEQGFENRFQESTTMKRSLDLIVSFFFILIALPLSPPNLQAQTLPGGKGEQRNFELWKKELNCGCMAFLPKAIIIEAFNLHSSEFGRRRLGELRGESGITILRTALFPNNTMNLEAVVVDFESKKVGVLLQGSRNLTPTWLSLVETESEALMDLVMSIADNKIKAIGILEGALNGGTAWPDAFQEYEKIEKKGLISDDTRAAVLGGLFYDGAKVSEALVRLKDFDPELHARCVAMFSEFKNSSRVIEGTIKKPVGSDTITIFDGKSLALLRGPDAFLDADGKHIFDTSLDQALQLVSKGGKVSAKITILTRNGTERLASAVLDTLPDDNKLGEDLQFVHLFANLPKADKHRVAMAYAGQLRDAERVFYRWDEEKTRIAQALTPR